MKKPLAELLDGPLLPPANSVPILRAFAIALRDLHALGELWDHSEQGIFILDDGRVLIEGTVSARSQRLKPGEIDVNRDILPPEYFANGSHDVRSDIYGWGVIAYEFITGESPFKAETVYKTMTARLSQAIELPQNFKMNIGMELSNIIATTLKRAPGERYQSTGDLLDALGTVLW